MAFLTLREESVVKQEDSLNTNNYEVYTLRGTESQVRRKLQDLRFFILLVGQRKRTISIAAPIALPENKTQ